MSKCVKAPMVILFGNPDMVPLLSSCEVRAERAGDPMIQSLVRMGQPKQRKGMAVTVLAQV